MRMRKVAVVLLVLASFVVAATAISMAATVTPTTKPMTGDRGMSDMRPLPKEMTMMSNAAKGVPAAQNATIGMPVMSNQTRKMPGMPNNTVGQPIMPNQSMRGPGTPNQTIGMPGMPNNTMGKPVMPNQTMLGMPKMKTDLGTVFKKLVNGITIPGQAMSSSGLGVKYKAGQMMGDTFSQIALSSGSSSQIGMSAPRPISQLSSLPKVGSSQIKT